MAMRNFICALAFALAIPAIAAAAEHPDWAFPVADRNLAKPKDDGQPKHAPGSTKSYTRAQIDDGFNPPDWYPDEHPPMPQVVAHGNGTTVRACALCHLPTGAGHDESANLAGLPLAYLFRTMHDYKTGARKGSDSMTAIAKAITEEEQLAALKYFAELPPKPWIRVVETDTVPRTYVPNKRLPHPDGGMEPIGNRIIEIPEDTERVLNRDPHSGFIAYVPKGSIARGEVLVTTGGGKTTPCGACHGATYQGNGDVPGISGRQATYVVRQLFMIQNGERGGNSTVTMKPVAEKLDLDDMLAIAAYLSSRAP
jgi:cytochrome c553